MYHFSEPLKTIIRETRQLQRQPKNLLISASPLINNKYDIFTENVTYPIGILTISCGMNNYHEDAYILVLAELNENKGRNNTIATDGNSTEAIAMAIGFTCGSAFAKVSRS